MKVAKDKVTKESGVLFQLTGKDKDKANTTTDKAREKTAGTPEEVREVTADTHGMAEVELSRAEAVRYRTFIEVWESRPVGFCLTTSAYQQTQKRMLMFMGVGEKARSAKFMEATARLRWSTRATYWVALRSAEKVLVAMHAPGAVAAPDGAKMQKHLEAKAETEVPLRVACTKAQLLQWVTELPPLLAGAAYVTFFAGQRLCDVMRLTRRSITLQTCYVAITFYAGKVVGIIGPFTIHVHQETRLARILMERCAALVEMDAPLFHSQLLSYDEERAIVSATMKESNASLDVRSLRRGGLQLMATAGMSLAAIRVFSKHASDAMLLKYLDHGKCLTAQAEMTACAIRHLECLPDTAAGGTM